MLVSANGKQAKFQFTRPRGARLHDAHKKEGAKCFNSRAHGGRDTYMQWVLRMCRSFNSRAHGGRDGNLVEAGQSTDVSIHAPTGGATRF